MRTKMSVVALVLAVTLGLSVATVGKAIADSCSGCGCCNAVWWTTATSPTTVTAAGDKSFSFSQVVNWTFDEARYQGTISYVDGSSTNINAFGDDAPSYTPNLFFPDDDCCTGNLTIQTTGNLVSDEEDGILATKVSIVSPLFTATKYVTIHHP